MTVVISPTISLMADQCASLTDKGISATFLGSAQSDKTMPSQVLQGKFRIVYTTPESFFASQGKPSKLFEELLQKHRVGLIAVDEAHLVLSWQSFRWVFNTAAYCHGYSASWLCLTANLHFQAFVCLDCEPASHQSWSTTYVPDSHSSSKGGGWAVTDAGRQCLGGKVVSKSTKYCTFCEAAKTGRNAGW